MGCATLRTVTDLLTNAVHSCIFEEWRGDDLTTPHQPPGPLVKWLSRYPVTVVSRVRISYGPLPVSLWHSIHFSITNT